LEKLPCSVNAITGGSKNFFIMVMLAHEKCVEKIIFPKKMLSCKEMLAY